MNSNLDKKIRGRNSLEVGGKCEKQVKQNTQNDFRIMCPRKVTSWGVPKNCKKKKRVETLRYVTCWQKKPQSPSACHRVRLATHRIINWKAFPNTETSGRYLRGNFEGARSLQTKFQNKVSLSFTILHDV